MLVLAGRSLARQVLDCLRGTTSDVFLVAGPNNAAYRHSPHCRAFAAFDFDRHDCEALESLIARIARSTRIDVILGCDIAAITAMIGLGDRLSVPHMPLPAAADFARHDDKWQFHALCSECAVATPKALVFADKTQVSFDDIADVLGAPFILKPLRGESGHGVVKIDDAGTFDRRIRRDPLYSHAPLLAQEFVPGYDIDLSLIAAHGTMVCHAVQIADGGVTRFVKADALVEMGERLVAHTGFNGITHIDARFDSRDGSFKLIESNPRFWASVAKAKACGLNFAAAAIDLALGRACGQPLTIAGREYQATPEFFGRFLCGKVPLGALRRSTAGQVWDNLSDPMTFVIKKFVRHREIIAERRAGLRG